MHHQVAFVEICEINVQRRPRRLRMRRLHPARPLYLVATEYFRIRHHHQLRRLANKSARQRTDLYDRPQLRQRSPGLFFRPNFRRRRAMNVFPHLLKSLPLAVVIAKNMDRHVLPQPAMQLLEKLPALRLRHLQFRRTLTQRPERIQRFKLRKRHIARRIHFGNLYLSGQFHRSKTAPVQIR